ncbi:amino acid adenylation domain-containing protein [Phytomonospora sp. NPDC050363]|uniref:amino acid adenylation domain-containing protein n=1 Tax=Phytomonospora sp. NPDC050363 TaxID=3155642 RepID=UPI0033C3B4B8
MSTIAMFGQRATDHADRPALSCADRTLTYRELRDVVAETAASLSALGVEPGDRVAVVARRSERMIVAELAVLALGAAFVPLSRDNPEERLGLLLGDCAPRCVVVCDGRLPTDLPVLDLTTLPVPGAHAGELPDPPPDSAVYCIYTSGTSGTPKGVVVEDAGLANLCANFMDPLLTIEDVRTVALVASFAFDASIKMIFGALTTGRHLRVITEDQRDDVAALAADLRAWNVDAIDCTPTYLGVLCGAWEANAPALKCVLVGGEPLDVATADRAAALTGATVYNVYGPTEATVDATCHRHEPGSARMSIGAPIPGADVRIVRNGRQVGRGLPGEIWIGGAGVARGYLGAPELTADKFIVDPFGEGSGRFYRTGDRGRTLPDGSFEHLGRLDEQVKIRGFRVEPDEIARTMEAVPGVTSAAVVVRGDSLAAFYTCAGEVGEDEVATRLRAALPDYMVPAVVVRLDSLPLTSNGKLDRAALRERPLPARAETRVVEPATPAETAVHDAIREVLKLDTLSMDANFFLLGGDSIKAILLVSALAGRGHRLGVRDVMGSLTPAEMAKHVEALATPAQQGIQEGEVTATPVLADFFGRDYRAPNHHHQTAELPLGSCSRAELPAVLRELTARHRILTATVRDGRLVVPPFADAAPPVLEDWDLTGHSEDDAVAERARRATALSAACDLANGPLVRAAVVRMPQRTTLFLAIHHLVVDGVSWHIIARDIAAITDALAAGTPPPAPSTSASFLDWATALDAFGQTPQARRDHAYWTQVADAVPALPSVPGAGTGRRRQRLALDRATGAALAGDRASERDADVQELLVAAVVAAAHDVWDLGRVPLTMESHGRSELPGLGELDVSATVGWFTSTYPVVLPFHEDATELLRSVRNTLRLVPASGTTAGLLLESPPETLGTVNYLGDLSGLGAGLNPYGEPSSALNLDRNRMSVDAALVDGEFVVDVELRADLATEAEAAAFGAKLRESLLSWAADPARRTNLRAVPADFGLRGTTVAQLDALLDGEDAGVESVCPLSPLQEGLLYEYLREADSDHVVQVEYSFPVAAEPGRLARAMAELARLTPTLRTVFAWEELTAPHQLVLAGQGIEFHHFDQSGLSTAERQEAVRLRSARQHERPFDLRRGPLFRCDAFTAGETTRLVFTHHHILLDGWSLAELCRRFSQIYTALGDPGRPLPPGERDGGPIPTYASFVRWATDRGTEEFDRYWSRLLDGYETAAAVPTAANGETPGDSGVGRLARSSDSGLARRLTDAFASRGVTLAHAAEAAWGLVLSRACGSPDVVFGKVVSGRDVPLPGVDKTVGLFINTIPVRIRVTAGTSVAGLLDAVRDQAVASAEHDHGSLARIQSLSGVEGLVGSLFAFENYHVDEGALDGAGLEFERAEEATNYPLTVTVQRIGDELEFVALHDKAQLCAADAERAMARLAVVLEQFATGGGTVGEVSTLLPGEAGLVLETFGGTRADYPRDGWIGEQFARTAATHPDRVALVSGGERIRYRELADRAGRIAGALHRAGVGVGDVVGVTGDPSAGLLTGLLGVVLSGAAYVPLDIGAPASRGALIAEDAAVSVIVTAGERATSYARQVAPAARIIDVAEAAAGEHPPALPRVPGGDDVAYVMFTSGTTGRPKGSLIPHRAVLRLVCGNEALPLNERDVLVQTGSLAFDASTFEIWGMWLNGGTLVVPDRDDLLGPGRLGTLVAEHGATVMWLTVSLFNHIAVTAPDAFTGLDRLLIGGEAVSAGHVRLVHDAVPDITVVNGYGPTENTTFTTTHPLPRVPTRTVPLGRPITNTTVLVLDGDRLCGVGETGELCTGGDGLSLGYLGLPELTARRFVAAPHGTGTIYRTGDRARWLADGTVEFLGRLDDEQIKIRGYRVELADVETAVRAFDGIGDTVVLAHREDDRTAALIAYVVAGTGLDLARLRTFLTERLPGYMVPAYLVEIPAIPVTRNGKLDRRALPAPVAAGSGTEFTAAADETEEAVCAVFARVLGVEAVGALDSFFELGGDSIKAIRVVSGIRAAGFEAKVGDVMAGMTAREVARRVVPKSTSAFEQGEVTGPVGGASPIVEEFFAWNLTAPAHFNQDVLVDVGTATAAHVRTALDAVWSHHDALRAVVTDRALHIRSAEDLRYRFEHRDATGLDAGELDHAVTALADELHASMDLENGPLLRAGLVTAPHGSRLFLAAHHLVVDAVSWQIIVEDTLSGIRAAQAGRKFAPPEKTAALTDWTKAAAALAPTLVPREGEYWDRVDRACAGAALRTGGADAGGGEREVVLDREVTAGLLSGAGAAYHADVEDLLLAGLAMTVADLTGQDRIAVRLERHGRSGHASLPAADRTVGWFTTMFPVVLAAGTDPGEAVVATKETLRAVPHEGFGYGLRPGGYAAVDASITFNYLARQDTAPGGFGATVFSRTGTPTHPDNRLPKGVRINALVRDERLAVTFSADPGVLTGAELTRLADRYLDDLTTVVGHCLGQTTRRRTPSDYSVAVPLSREDLARIESLHPGHADIADLTPLQEGMLFHGLEDPESGAYIVQQVFFAGDESGPFDLGAVATALRTSTADHAVLRTAFPSQDLARPRQVVLPNREPGFAVVDLSGVGEAEARAAIERLLAEDVARGFDLARDPLLRVTAIRTTEDERQVLRLVWTYHHIVLDGWSLSTLFGDFLGHYRAAVGGTSPAERTETPSYAAYVRHLADRDSDETDRYWSRLLDEYDSTAAVSGSGGGTGVGRVLASSDGALARRLTDVFAARGVTLAHAAEAAWGIVLSRAVGEPDVVFGKVVSGRDAPLPGIDKTVGLFINTIPVRVQIPADGTVADLVEAVRDQAAASAEHDHGSLARIQSLAGVENLVQCLFAFENFHVEEGVLDGGGLTFERAREEETGYALNLVAQQEGEELSFSVLHDRAVLAPADAERVLARVLHVLEQFAGNTAAPLGEVSTLLPGETATVVEEFNRTTLPYPADMTAVSAFLDGVREHPDRTALVWREETMTYRELAEAAAKVAGALAEDGVPRGAGVGILGERSFDLIVGILGTMLAGCFYVPLDVGSPAERIRRIVSDGSMRAVLTYGPRADEIVASLGGMLDGYAVRDLASLRGAAEIRTDRLPSPQDPAYCIYTSGTTGAPKGVMLSHRGVANLRAYLRETYGVVPADRVLQFSNLTFDAAVWEIGLSLLNGASLLIVDQDVVHDADLLVREARRQGVTLGLLPPQYYLQCEGLPMRIVTTGGGASSLAVVEKARRAGVGYVNAFGPTETTVLATGWLDTGADSPARIPIGRPVSNTRAYVMDGERLCGIGEIGELCAAGDGLSSGYVGLPELTAERFVANPFGEGRLYRTGDRARWLPDGNLEFLGRVDDAQVKVRGYRIEVGEIETAIRSHPEVRDTVVVADLGPDHAATLTAYVVATGGEPDVRAFLTERLPAYMVPAYFVAIDEIPLTRNGKLDRAALPAPTLNTERTLPADEVESAVCEAFADVLGLAAVGATDGFFELGGDSIKAIRVVSRLRAAGYEVSVGAVMAAMTARELAPRVGRKTVSVFEQGEVTGRVEGASPILAEFFGWGLAAPAHFNQDMVVDVGFASAAQVRAVLDAVWAHHDALRATVADETLVIRSTGELAYGFEHHDTDAGGLDDTVARAADRLHASMDLDRGPLLRAALVSSPTGSRLFLAAHHLVVDAVSWLVLVEDVLAGIRAAQSNRPIALPEKTASLSDWGRALDALAVTPEENAYWDAVDRAAAVAGLVGSGGVPGEVAVCETTLDPASTADLLGPAGAAYSADVEDLLLAALAMSVGGMTGQDRVAVRLERHGRTGHESLPAVDRTVGWFTSMYPVVLGCGTDPAAAIVGVKETLRAVPHDGIGYGLREGGYAAIEAPITFNYLGRQDGEGTGGFGSTRFATGGVPSHPDNRFHAGVRINVLHRGEGLVVTVTCDSHVLSPVEGETLAGSYGRNLVAVVRHCLSLGESHKTISDTDATDLSGEDLDALNALFG